MIFTSLILFILLFFDKNIHVYSTPPICVISRVFLFLLLFIYTNKVYYRVNFSSCFIFHNMLYELNLFCYILCLLPKYHFPPRKNAVPTDLPVDTAFPSFREPLLPKSQIKYSNSISHLVLCCLFILPYSILSYIILNCCLLCRAYYLLAILVYLTYLHFAGFARINFIHKTKKRRSEVECLE